MQSILMSGIIAFKLVLLWQIDYMSSLRDFKGYLPPCFYQYARAYGTFLTS